MKPRRRRVILTERAKESALLYREAEARAFELALSCDPVDARRAAKARLRSMKAGDRLADDLSRLHDIGLFEFASNLVLETRHAIYMHRRLLSGRPRGAEGVPHCHPIADPSRQYLASYRGMAV